MANEDTKRRIGGFYLLGRLLGFCQPRENIRRCPGLARQISMITGMISGRRPVVFWIRRFKSTRTFSLTMP